MLDNFFERFRNRDKAAPFIPVMVCDDNGVFYYEDDKNPKDRGIASCCIFSPLSGIDGKSLSALTTMLNTEMPAGTIMQFIQMGSPVLDSILHNYTNVRNDSVLDTLSQTVDHSAIKSAQYAVHNRADFLRSGSKRPLVQNQRTVITETICFWTIRVPVVTDMPFNGNSQTDRKFQHEVNEFIQLRTQLLSAMEVAGIQANVMNEKEVLSLLRKYFKIYDQWDDSYNPDQLLNQQIFPVASSLKWGERQNHNTIHCSGFSKNYERQNIGMLVVDKYPTTFSIYRMLEMLGDLSGQGVSFGLPYCLSTIIHFPNQEGKKTKFRGNQMITSKQSKNPNMLEWSEKLKRKKVGFQIMSKAIADGGNVVEATTTLTLFSPSKNELTKSLSRIEAYYQSFGLIMRRETYIPEVSLFNNLPMNASPESIKNTERFKTMMSAHVAHLLPILDEWCGIDNFKDGVHHGNAMVLSTRLGRLFNYSLFSPHNANFNWTMVAGAGAGKSFFVQRLTQDYLSIGTKIWTIDTGSSYLAAARASGAQIIDFDKESNICLNPFTKINDLEEEMALLLPIFEKMTKPNEGFTDKESALMEDAINSVFRSCNRNATIDDIVDFLNNQIGEDSETQHDLAKQLMRFSSAGSMGKWFNGENNFEPEADWTVLELSGLNANRHLCDVVLMMISTTIAQEMYVKRNDNRKKMLIIEEGGDRVTDPAFAEFIAKLYSKVRKEGGSVGVITQTLAQMYSTDAGSKIMASAHTQFYMQQTPEAIAEAIEKKWIKIDSYTEQLMNDVRTEKGRFSEVLVRSGKMVGIARLIETPFNRVLFSTEGDFFKELQRRVRAGEQIVVLVAEEARQRYPEEMAYLERIQQRNSNNLFIQAA